MQMRNTTRLLSVLTVIVLCQIVATELFAEETIFDYTKYLPPAVVERVEKSQMILLKYYGGGDGTRYETVNGILIGPGIILTAAHYLRPMTGPATEAGSPLTYKGIPLVPVFEREDYDLAILKAAEPIRDKTPIDLSLLTTSLEPFEDYYALGSIAENYYADSQELDYPSHLTYFQLPFKGELVAAPRYPVPAKRQYIRLLYIRGMARDGFSGAGLFSKDGKLAGLLSAVHRGYTLVTSTETILQFLEEYRVFETEKLKPAH